MNTQNTVPRSMRPTVRQVSQEPRPMGWTILRIVLVAVLAAFLYLGLKPSGLSDTEQISAILDDIRAGTASQNADTIFSHIASNFQIGGLNRAQARFELVQFLRKNPSTSAVFRQPQISINGDQAAMEVYTEVNGGISGMPSGGNSSHLYEGEVHLDFVKEPTHRFLIFPDHAWKVVKANVPNLQGIEGF